MKSSLEGRFKARLSALGMTQVEFVRLFGQGLSKQTVRHWFVRDSVPGAKLFRAADLLQCDPRWLLTGEEAAPIQHKDLDVDKLTESILTAIRVFEEAYPDWSDQNKLRSAIKIGVADYLNQVEGLVRMSEEEDAELAGVSESA